MSLYQCVRPIKFDEVVGNSTIVGALVKLLKQSAEKQSHTIMLTGPSGCGKTTIARILAKGFGSGDTGIIELNAANTRGIDTIREVTNNAHLYGIGSLSKTYIFDESHELTKPAQEALLKIIEDNPPHCYFILCTTEPQNLLKTVRNRCSIYEVNTLSSAEIIELLTRVVKKLDLTIDNQILEGISYICEGCPRTALVQLEQVIDVKDVDEALELLVKGTERDANIIDLCKLLMMAPEIRQKKWKKIITTYSLVDEDGEKARRSILTFLFNRLKKADNIEEAKDITRLLSIFSTSVYYGGKAALGTLVAKACF